MEIKKKFFRTFTSPEQKLIDELVDVMQDCYVQVPPFVIRRMIDRGIIPANLELLDEEGNLIKHNLHRLGENPAYQTVENAMYEGLAFEFNNEGANNPYSPYRMVWAAEEGGYTYFVKVSIPPKNGTVRIIDVWRKRGATPFYPIPAQKELFVRGAHWDIEKPLSDLLAKARVGLLTPAGEEDEEWEDELDGEVSRNAV